MSSYSVDLQGKVNQEAVEQRSLLVRIWDLGPKVPGLPAKPALPEGKEGSPAHDLAMIDFEAELAAYRNALNDYSREKKAFEDWHKRYAGPYQFETHSVNAREAIQIEPDRYVCDLPKGRKAGKYQQEQIQREVEQRRTFAQTVANDPVFGTQGAPA